MLKVLTNCSKNHIIVGVSATGRSSFRHRFLTLFGDRDNGGLFETCGDYRLEQ